MARRKALLESELPQVISILPEFSARDQALVTLGFNTGFRISELLSLNLADVWDGERVRPRVKVTRAKMKGGAGVRRKGTTSRTVPLNEAATQALQRHLSAQMGQGEMQNSEPLFPSRFHGKRLTRWGANEVVPAVLARAGIDGNGDYGTHTPRKTFCRQADKNSQHDLNLTRAVMGHSSCATTRKYRHVDEAEITRAVMGLSTQGGAIGRGGPRGLRGTCGSACVKRTAVCRGKKLSPRGNTLSAQPTGKGSRAWAASNPLEPERGVRAAGAGGRGDGAGAGEWSGRSRAHALRRTPAGHGRRAG